MPNGPAPGNRYARLRSLLGEVAFRSRFYRAFYRRAGITIDEEFLENLEHRFDELSILETDYLLGHSDDIRFEEDCFRVTCTGGTIDTPMNAQCLSTPIRRAFRCWRSS